MAVSRPGTPTVRPAPSFDPFFPVIVLLGAAAVFWTFTVYQPAPRRPFPRQPADFRSPAALDAAVQTAEKTLAETPENVEALLDLAIAQYERGPSQYKEALKSLEKARELGALDERLFYFAGVMYESENLPEYAAPDLERYARRHPEDMETRLRLGNLYFRTDELDKSIDSYRRVLAKKPGDALVSFNLAFVLRDRKNWPEALDALKPFTEGGRAMPTGGHKLLGDLFRGRGDLPKALEEYALERNASGDSAELALAMAQAYQDAGQDELALERWEHVAQLDPKNREARTRLRRLKKRLARASR